MKKLSEESKIRISKEKTGTKISCLSTKTKSRTIIYAKLKKKPKTIGQETKCLKFIDFIE
jgi:hypothetical protein